MNKFLAIKPQRKRIIFRYLLSPFKLIGSNNSIVSALYQQNMLKPSDSGYKAIIKPNAPLEKIETDLFIKSIGFKSVQIDENLPFDKKKNIIPNKEGVVFSEDKIKRMYTAGWVKTGPKGTIANTFDDSEETVMQIINDIKNNEIMPKEGEISFFIIT